jgi:phenylalanyl-tRNA synthetase beta chain
LITGIIRNVGLNLNRQAESIRIFEVGKAYIPNEDGLPKEITKVVGAVTGRRQLELWDKEEFDFFDLKGVLERVFEALGIARGVRLEEASQIRFLHPGKSARVLIGREEVGFLGELHPDFQEKLEIPKRVYLFELDLQKLASFVKSAKKGFAPLPKFPSVRRDIALIVNEELPAGEILDEIRKLKLSLIEEASVFDVFRGKPVEEGKKSIAIALTLRAAEKTLTEEEINEVQTKVLNRLKSALGGELRTT